MSQATSQQLRYSFPEAKSIGVPSLRKYGNTNKLVYVQKVAQAGLVAAVISRMKALHNQFNNFIVLCKDIETLRGVQKALTSESSEYLLKDRKVVIFEQFERNHSTTAADLRSLKQSNFIVLTTRQGGIAVDYQGTLVSHPIITYGTKNTPELV